MLLLIFALSPVYGEEKIAEQRVTVFIDISGSMYPVFSEIKQAVLDEVFSDLEIGTELTIYKFYRKIVPIYEGRLKRKSDIDYAKSRVLALKANGPWTDIQKVFAYIQDHQTEDEHYFIFTDGKHETEDGLHDFELTDTIVKDQLGNNVKLINKDTWKIIDYVYKPVVDQKQPEVMTPPVQDTKEPIKPPVPVKVMQEKTSFNLWWLLWIILIIIAIIIIFMLLRARASYAASNIGTSDAWKPQIDIQKLNLLAELKQSEDEKASKDSSEHNSHHYYGRNEPHGLDGLRKQTMNWERVEASISEGQPTLTDEEQKAVNVWTSDEGYKKINNSLRYPNRSDSHDEYYKQKVDRIRKAMEKSRLPRLTLQRRTNLDFLKGLGIPIEDVKRDPSMLKGNIIQERGFLATSPSDDCSFPRHSTDAVQLIIESPAGQKGLYLEQYTEFKGEHEVLLPPNTSIKITGGEVTDFGIRFYAKVV